MRLAYLLISVLFSLQRIGRIPQSITVATRLDALTPRSPPPPPPNRPAGPANDLTWERCRAKGCTFTWAMQANDADVGPTYAPERSTAGSPWRNFNDLLLWFWRPFPNSRVDERFHDFYGRYWGVGDALEGLGVSPYSELYEGGKNILYFFDHQSYDPEDPPDVNDQRYQLEEGGKIYRATGASYCFSVNPWEGVIIGFNRKSPRYAAKERGPPVPEDELPAVSQFSDIAWLHWDGVTRARHTEVTSLRYFLSVGIDNTETKSVIRRAMDSKGWQLSEWPGHTFERRWEETRAIIGTPNVQGFAYLLIQHKDVLGNMFIDKVQVFHGDTTHQNPCIVMHLSKPRVDNVGVEGRKDSVRTHVIRAQL
ncbi:hypothetical protein P153DRAFT_372328 [Dothidotthia symphoricarpi CBS 119687]|uniref:Uncharacterized protein n=1 Tax=Dothidotthia symphoricarpi CBS 119687 TaxID=1392245 RepID=A0A6A6ARD9_9PLEO|nr:uncharacterized protein P153DRAFT_372328 [Dothidotthia symphoricarpi CBS 119687]KAF2133738.1 hypothetical protein P153DRAFT_372328 [Dothidotthia symphoricarpi CBS 119687]